jgi:hypothetical protein
MRLRITVAPAAAAENAAALAESMFQLVEAVTPMIPMNVATAVFNALTNVSAMTFPGVGGDRTSRFAIPTPFE